MSTTDIPNSAPFVEKTGWFALGFVAIAFLQAATGWWLNSGTGVLRTILVLVALGWFATFRRTGRAWGRAWGLWAGAISGSTVVLFWVGPGNIWPIVLVVAAAIMAGAVFGGTGLGLVLTKRRDMSP